MLRSIGRALGDVAVDGGAEKVCEPRLPKLPPRPARASASLTANASTATSAQNASNGRKAKRDIDSSQETIRFDLTYWGPMTAFKEVPHGVADGLRSRRRERFGQIHGGTRTCTQLATASLVNFAASQVQSGNGTSLRRTFFGASARAGAASLSRPGRLRLAEPAAVRGRTCRRRRDRRAAAWAATAAGAARASR